MRLSITELRLLEQVANGNKRIKGLALALHKSPSQIYKVEQKLGLKGFISRSNGQFTPERITHVTLLLQLLSSYPSVIKPLANSGISLFTALVEERTIQELIKDTKLNKTSIFRKLKEGRQISLVAGKKRKYSLNAKIWPAAKEFLLELKKYEETTDARIPPNSTVYFKNESEIVFSTKERVEAALTGFSAYSNYGIKVFMPEEVYCLPKKKLGIREVFMHSLYVTEKDRSARNIALISLFYAKFKDKLPGIKHPLIDLIKKALAGEKIPGCPDLNEIREKADVYDIKI